MTADAELVGRAVGGDPDATATLLAQIRPGIVRYCWAHLGRFGGNCTSPDDVVQEVFLAVLQALPRYQDQGRPFTSFAYAIAAHKVADAQRAAMRGPGVAPVEALLTRPDSAPGPEHQAVATDVSRRIWRLLGKLSRTHQEIVVLRVAAGLSADEVGAVLGMSAPAVRVAQHRALNRLREMARETFDELRVSA